MAAIFHTLVTPFYTSYTDFFFGVSYCYSLVDFGLKASKEVLKL